MCVCKCVCDSINICIQLFMFIDTILHAFYSSLHSGDKTLRDLLFFSPFYLFNWLFFLSFNAQVSQLVGSFELLCAAPNTMHPWDLPLYADCRPLTLFSSSTASLLSSCAPVICKRMEGGLRGRRMKEEIKHTAVENKRRNPIKDRSRRKCTGWLPHPRQSV